MQEHLNGHPLTRLTVALRQGAYPILVGEKIRGAAGECLRRELNLASEKVFIVTDANVAPHYLSPLQHALRAAGLTVPDALVLPAGEATKSLADYERVVAHFLNNGARRDDVVLALGGGVVGDLAGFAAATVLRGLRLVQMPTTLLAQVDSSVGGKTGINLPQGKNLLGSFHQPSLVLIDTETLATLPVREKQAGYAEVLKYALINDAAFFDWLEQYGAAVLAGHAAFESEAITRSCAAKAAIVAADPLERLDLRALLNLGHTFGHALEALGGYDGRLLHGEAVAIGMRWAFDFAVEEGLCPAGDRDRMQRHMDAAGLMQKPPFAVTAQDVAARMAGDKKNTAAGLTLILPRGIGAAAVFKAVEPARVLGFLQRKTGE